MDDRLILKNINVNYGSVKVLKDINMVLKPGEVNTLIGLNGAGKTTLLKSICGILDNVSGDIFLNNINIRDLKDKDRGKMISFIPQNIHSNQDYSVEDIVTMGITPYLSIFEMPCSEHYEKAREILKELNLYHLKDKCIGDLSGGERRMVYLGRVLMQRSKIVLLDEPNTFLDCVRQHDLFKFMIQLIKEKNLISLFTLHDINLALRYSDKIYILNENKITEVIDCRKKGYEEKLINELRRVYSKDFSIIETKVGPMLIY
ncbi:ABC transporter ATP-binding protein [Clostridium sp. Ade.TY]|uniref:ABC transporter ATP-binding protein n=1 Tax=Clostridium sp. Ade.TY TaxID=1391647 RepID=UPI00041D6813|nr:ABC transporter ATP-binding protein [Clostridium sp. Ade.TY]